MTRNSITGFIVMAFVMLFLSGCSVSKQRSPFSYFYTSFYEFDEIEFFTSVFSNKTELRDYIVKRDEINLGLFLWRSDKIDVQGSSVKDSAISTNLKVFIPLSDVKRNFRLEEKAMYKNQTRIDSFFVRFAESEDNFATIRFFIQLKGIQYYNSKYPYRSWKMVYLAGNNMYEISFNHPERFRRKIDKLEFNNGSGVWRDYYFVTSPVDKFVLKEKGRIRDNYKVGKWKYYDKEGNLTHTRRYKKSDKVDVRFPYCIWNEVEPCYCDE